MGLGRCSVFLICTKSVGLLGPGGGGGVKPVARPLPSDRITQKTQNKRHTIPVFERAKTVHALDREATLIGI
jgi:hypothetical protein